MQTLFQFITRARLTLVDGTSKWHNSQIFIPHTALMRHLFSQIRISYLYTWYMQSKQSIPSVKDPQS